MVQKIKERKGYILLHFDSPPADLGRIEFVVIIAHQQGQILYSRWREDGSWTLPSGRVKQNETPEEAAHRELLEETGATLKKMRALCYMHCFMFGREYWGTTYLGEIDELGAPIDSREVTETSMFADIPGKLPHEFKSQVTALHRAALEQILSLANDGYCMDD